MDTPTLSKLPSNAPINSVLAVLSHDGGLIIKNLVSPTTLDSISTELTPFAQPDQIFAGKFFPQATKRICGVVGKSPTLATAVLCHPLYREVCDRLLTIEKKSRYGDSWRHFYCRPVGNASTTFDIGPGADAQQLHRDDGVHHLEHPLERPCMIGMLVAETKTTINNGATVVIPGSHKWGDTDIHPNPSDAIPVCLEPGDALLFDGAIFHGGGANTTTNERRKVHGVFMIRGNLRPEENTYLSFPPSIAKNYPDEVLEAYGYKASGSGLGWVGYKEPMVAVLGRECGGSLRFDDVGIPV